MTTQQWIDEFVIELRMRDVTGKAIGDAVAVVESHIAESGESCDVAFGDPRSYAESLEFSNKNKENTDFLKIFKAAVPSLIGGVGILLIHPTMQALFDKVPVAISWGMVIAIGELVSAVLLLLGLWRMAMRVLVPKKKLGLSLGWLLMMLAAVGIAITVSTVKKVAFTIPSSVAVIAILLMIIIGSLGLYSYIRNDSSKILDPVTGVDRYADNKYLIVPLIFIYTAAIVVIMNLIPYLFGNS